jgi:hypothetical protein
LDAVLRPVFDWIKIIYFKSNIFKTVVKLKKPVVLQWGFSKKGIRGDGFMTPGFDHAQKRILIFFGQDDKMTLLHFWQRMSL